MTLPPPAQAARASEPGASATLPDQNRQQAFEQRYRAAYGTAAHPLASVAYDGVAAIAQSLQQGRSDALTGKALTRANGFAGAGGGFRLNGDGTNTRALAIATVRNKQVIILDPASSGTGGAGF